MFSVEYDGLGALDLFVVPLGPTSAEPGQQPAACAPTARAALDGLRSCGGSKSSGDCFPNQAYRRHGPIRWHVGREHLGDVRVSALALDGFFASVMASS